MYCKYCKYSTVKNSHPSNFPMTFWTTSGLNTIFYSINLGRERALRLYTVYCDYKADHCAIAVMYNIFNNGGQ